MQIEVKLSIDSVEGYERASRTLSSHHLKDECYYDVFFDFTYRALQERNSVLRLRVPCELESVADATAHANGAQDDCADEVAEHEATLEKARDNASNLERIEEARGGSSSVYSGGGYDPDAEYEAFLRACRGHSSGTDNAGAPTTSSGGASANTLNPPAVHFGNLNATARTKRTLPQPIFIPNANGKLFLKQKNTVQEGHQMNFVAEDADVPSDVVAALVALVPDSLYTTGMIFSPAQATAGEAAATNAFAVLSAYAQRRPRSDDGSGDSAVARIVAHLRDIARAYAPSTRTSFGGVKRARSGSQESDAHFTQVRFSAMGSRTAYTQQQLATSALTENEEPSPGSLQQQQRRSGSVGAAVPVPRLEAVGGFLTRRRLYAYTGVHQALGNDGGATAGSPREAERRETLRVRLDTSFLLPGFAIYELEVPKCGVAVEDVKEEVCAFLKKLAVPYHAGSESKYARYVHYLAATREEEHDAMDVKLRLTNVNGYEEVRRNLQRLTQPAGATGGAIASASLSGEAPRASQEKRYVSNTEVDDEDGDAGGGGGDDDTWWQTNPSGYLQETNEDFFFDSPKATLRQGQTFLRLRKQRHLNKYILVLKAHQVFTGGQQRSLSSKLDLSEGVAHDLIENPTKFLRDHHDNFSLMKTIWEEFGVRELCRTATFTTERLTVPWWSATTQPSTLQRSWCSGSANGPALPPQSQPIYTSTSYLLSQKQQQQQSDECDLFASASGKQLSPPVPPMLIHLDKTLYKLPPNVKPPARVPFSQGRPWADRQCETYEIEVTNIESSTEPKMVIAELTELLNSMGVEWTTGMCSKLEQYFSLIDV